MAKFPDRLKELRLAAGLTQVELAEKLGLSKGAVGNYEAGKRSPDYETLEAIADYFNVELDYLQGRTNSRPEYTLEEQWVISCFRNADADTREGIKAILRRFDKKDSASQAVS